MTTDRGSLNSRDQIVSFLMLGRWFEENSALEAAVDAVPEHPDGFGRLYIDIDWSRIGWGTEVRLTQGADRLIWRWGRADSPPTAVDVVESIVTEVIQRGNVTKVYMEVHGLDRPVFEFLAQRLAERKIVVEALQCRGEGRTRVHG